ncbi:MAG: endonuclease [Betaproteobacteria bacterium 13_1_40CM_4_64_4]|nr:MAG: endonuclease [Betaproteobacteria bacterium 13_1_40CM_4_64_4]
MAQLRVTVASYNIHIGIGRDGQFAPQRIASVLQELHADIIALQEVQLGSPGFNMFEYLRTGTGLRGVARPTLVHPIHGDYGNALLTRHRVKTVQTVDLAVAGHEPRSALDVILDCDGAPLRVLATHLGLHPGERRTQVRRLLDAIDATAVDAPTVLAGDVNEWFLWGRPLRWLHEHFSATPAPRTFPAGRPMFALDRIWVRPRSYLREVRAHASDLSRLASDHLPIVAQLRSPG